MKILLLCGGRVGSYSVAEWLAEELNLLFIVEKDYSVDYKTTDNIILKRTISNDNFDLEDVKYFDKTIILYRNNTLKQSESNMYAILNGRWHHTSKTKTDGYYEINEDFLIEHHNNIWGSKKDLNRQKKEMLSLNFGLKISYEDIFENEIGQKIIENYIGFESKTLLDKKLKLRKDDYESGIRSYKREINKLISELEELYYELNEIKNNNKTLNDKNEKLYLTITDLNNKIIKLKKKNRKLL